MPTVRRAFELGGRVQVGRWLVRSEGSSRKQSTNGSSMSIWQERRTLAVGERAGGSRSDMRTIQHVRVRYERTMSGGEKRAKTRLQVIRILVKRHTVQSGSRVQVIRIPIHVECRRTIFWYDFASYRVLSQASQHQLFVPGIWRVGEFHAQ